MQSEKDDAATCLKDIPSRNVATRTFGYNSLLESISKSSLDAPTKEPPPLGLVTHQDDVAFAPVPSSPSTKASLASARSVSVAGRINARIRPSQKRKLLCRQKEDSIEEQSHVTPLTATTAGTQDDDETVAIAAAAAAAIDNGEHKYSSVPGAVRVIGVKSALNRPGFDTDLDLKDSVNGDIPHMVTAELALDDEAKAAQLAKSLQRQIKEEVEAQVWMYGRPNWRSNDGVNSTVCGLRKRTCGIVLFIFILLLGGVIAVIILTLPPSPPPTTRNETSMLFRLMPSGSPSASPSTSPSVHPSASPSGSPSVHPSASPSMLQPSTPSPTVLRATASPTVLRVTASPTVPLPVANPSASPTVQPSTSPTVQPSTSPTVQPSTSPTVQPSTSPSVMPSLRPSGRITQITTNPTAVASASAPGLSPTVTTPSPFVPVTTLPTSLPPTLQTAIPFVPVTSNPTESPIFTTPTMPTANFFPTATPTFVSSSPSVQPLIPFLVPETLQAILIRTPEDLIPLEDTNSSRSLALEWLSTDVISLAPNVSTDNVLERYVLAVLYFSTDGDNWSNGVIPFLNENSICQWNNGILWRDDNSTGVYCEGTTSVRHILLNQVGLAGSLPWELSLLPDLVMLDLNNNALTGTIPTEYSQMKNLTAFGLCCNELSGPFPLNLQSSSLQSLNLSFNSLNGSLTSEFGQFLALESFDISHNSLSGPLPSELGQLAFLEELQINHNDFTGTIPIELAQLTRLTQFSLEFNNLTGSVNNTLCVASKQWFHLSSDCMDYSSGQAEIECSCCTHCCTGTPDICLERSLE